MEYTEEQTFTRLRRVTYEEACVEYTMLYYKHGNIVSKEFTDDLKKVGWTVSELYDEGDRREGRMPN